MSNRDVVCYATGAALFGAAVGYVPNEKVWRRTLAKYAVKAERDVPFLTDVAGRCTRFQDKKGRLLILINVDADRTAKLEMTQVVGVLVHESVHAWRFILDDIGQSAQPEPVGHEIEAYAIQSISQAMIAGHRDTQKRPWTTPTQQG